MALTIAVDAMGGDVGVAVTVPAVLEFLSLHSEVQVILVGKVDAIEAQLKQHRGLGHARLRVQPATEVVEMDEAPTLALRGKRDSSMRIAINMVKDGQAQAVVSAGNTGALLAMSKFVLKMLPGIERPALCQILPSREGSTCVLDLGANVDCSAEQLLQFGIMGSVLMAATQGRERPLVGLLNVGSEANKGHDVVKEAGELLQRSGLNFKGNVEGNDIFLGTVDVVVTDGFTGNALLKASEGLAKMLYYRLKQQIGRNIGTKLLGLLAYPVLMGFKQSADPGQYNGASLLGLRGVVIKSHGGAGRKDFRHALERALESASGGVIALIQKQLAEHLGQNAAEQEV